MAVNQVVKSGYSIAHAEILALSLAQKAINSFDLGANHRKYELVTSGAPCAMCFGAILWSGISTVVSAATASDICELTGFDEGPMHPNWKQEASNRGISLQEEVLREEARALLSQYKNSGLPIYNTERL